MTQVYLQVLTFQQAVLLSIKNALERESFFYLQNCFDKR